MVALRTKGVTYEANKENDRSISYIVSSSKICISENIV